MPKKSYSYEIATRTDVENPTYAFFRSLPYISYFMINGEVR